MLNRRLTLLAVPLVMLLNVSVRPAWCQDQPRAWAEKHLDEIVELYHHFHSHPELSFMEKETAARLAKELRAAGVEVTENVGGTGVVGVLKNGNGKTIMLRTDLDALPVTEQTGLAHASKVKVTDPTTGVEVGVMHACGHDIHIANLIATARYLAEHKSQWKGTIVFIGQPAEERGSGAKAMLEDGLFEKFPKPDLAIALHDDATLAAHKVGVRGGWSMANVDSIDITIIGRGGHGAAPHTTVDPIVTAAQLVLALQTVVSREMKPTDPAVVTVGSIHAGTKHNIISDRCQMQLTVRSYSDEVREKILSGIRRRAEGICQAAGCPEPPVIKISEGTPALFNDEQLAGRIRELFIKEFGKENVEESEATMGGEDFSQYARAGVPVLMFRVGAVEEKRLARMKELGQDPPSLHSPIFYPDAEITLVTALHSLVAATLDLLK
ncbi:MAG TPA: amidohydrolase [Pirellulaceae bacterium]|nr:amidohydrolase [Pirellulaceae bacterium]